MSNRQKRRNLLTRHRARESSPLPAWLTDAVAAADEEHAAAATRQQRRYLQALIRRISEGQH